MDRTLSIKIYPVLETGFKSITGYHVSLMNEDDPDWLGLRYLPLPKVLEQFLKELKMTDKTFQTNQQARGNGNSKS